MRYKSDPWYLAGLIVTALSAIVIAVTMVMMYYGSNVAIIICFSAMPFLAIGILLAQSTKRRYEEADLTNGEPLPIFWRIRFAFHNTKYYLSTSRMWRGLFISLCAFFVAVAVTLGGLCIYWSSREASIKNSKPYIEAVTQYDTYYAQWQEARKNGDEAAKEEAFDKMQQANEVRQTYFTKIKNYKLDVKFTWPWIVLNGACAVFCGTMYYVYGVKKREDPAPKKNRKT